MMTTVSPSSWRTSIAAAAFVAAVVGVGANPAGSMTAADAIRQAVDERFGGDVEVSIVALDLPARAGSVFKTARPDPAARLGRPMRFTLVPVQGSPVVAVATLKVIGDHVVTRRAIDRHETLTGEDVSVVRGELRDVPLRRLPTGEQVIGSRVLRPMNAASVVLPGSVAIRRAVEPGDTVTVVAIAGEIEVSATLTATDGGNPGDVIRVVNADTRRSLRGRVVQEGLVEVRHER